MLTVSNDFKNAIKQLAVISDGYVEIDNGTSVLTFDSDKLSKIEIIGSAYQNEKVLGNIAQHSLSLDLLGDQTANIDLTKENVVSVYIGVDVSGTYEYVKQQKFLITECEYSDTSNLTKITGADYLIKLNKEYLDSNDYSSPITLYQYLQSVVGFCGLTLENGTITNGTFSLASEPFSDYTSAKEIISKIAELALSYVVINKVSNSVEFRNAFVVGETDDSVSKDNYWSLKFFDNNFGTNGINTLVIGYSQVEGENNTVENSVNVAIDGAIEVKIMDNDLLNTEDKRISVITDMFNLIDGYKYQPFQMEYRGFPYLELGDLVVVEKMGETSVVVPILDYTLKYDGGLYGQIKALATNKVQTSNKWLSTTKQRIRNAEIRVDKVEGEISLIASEVDTLGTNYSSLVITVDGINSTVANQDGRISTIEQNVDSITDTINSVNSDLQQVKTVFRETADGFEITKTVDLGGGETKIASITSGFDNDNNAYIKIDDGGSDVATITSNRMTIANAEITNEFIVGNHKVTAYSSGDTIWQKKS